MQNNSFNHDPQSGAHDSLLTVGHVARAIRDESVATINPLDRFGVGCCLRQYVETQSTEICNQLVQLGIPLKLAITLVFIRVYRVQVVIAMAVAASIIESVNDGRPRPSPPES